MLQRWAQVAKEAISSLTAQDPNRLFLRDQRDIENRGEPPLPAEDYYAIPHMSAQERIDAIHVQVKKMFTQVRLSALRNFGMLTPTFRFNDVPSTSYSQPREVTWLLVTHLYVPIIQYSRNIGSFDNTDFVEFPSSISGMKTFGYYTEYVHLVADTVWREMYRQPDRYELFEEDGSPCNAEDREAAARQWIDAMRSEQEREQQLQPPPVQSMTEEGGPLNNNNNEREETWIDMSALSPDRGVSRRRNGMHDHPPPPPPPPPPTQGPPPFQGHKKNKDE